MKDLLKKLSEARKIIRATQIKKAGLNKFSGFGYFTPEQIEQLTSDACEKTGLITTFDLKRNELGEYGELKVIDIDTEQSLIFTMITAVPDIKATNAAQQIGGCQTYTKRYSLMNAFDIAENDLDPDSKDNSAPEKKWLNVSDKAGTLTKEWNAVCKAINEGRIKTVADVEQHYKINAETTAKIQTLIKTKS
jgi:hypothetical protein